MVEFNRRATDKKDGATGYDRRQDDRRLFSDRRCASRSQTDSKERRGNADGRRTYLRRAEDRMFSRMRKRWSDFKREQNRKRFAASHFNTQAEQMAKQHYFSTRRILMARRKALLEKKRATHKNLIARDLALKLGMDLTLPAGTILVQWNKLRQNNPPRKPRQLTKGTYNNSQQPRPQPRP